MSDDSDTSLYDWVVGTRRLNNPLQIQASLDYMLTIGGKWGTFGKWIEENAYAYVLWFQTFYKEEIWGSFMMNVMLDTNANESSFNRIKSNSEFRRTSSRGMPLLRLVDLLEEMDRFDEENVLKRSGMQLMSTPAWKRSFRSKKRRMSEAKFDDGVTVSEPASKRRK